MHSMHADLIGRAAVLSRDQEERWRRTGRSVAPALAQAGPLAGAGARAGRARRALQHLLGRADEAGRVNAGRGILARLHRAARALGGAEPVAAPVRAEIRKA